MKLRLISGALKGRMITIPDKDQDFRPTKDRVRESVASILSPDIHAAQIVDICAGSGAFGLEMVSRGAQSALFVEEDTNRCRLIRKHAEAFGVDHQCSFIEKSVQQFIARNTRQFDIIFYDPPYEDPALAAYGTALQQFLSPRGILVYERRARFKKRRTDTPIPDDWTEIRSYGETEICIFRKNHA